MIIACAHDHAAKQALDLLKRHGITRGISWYGPNAIDTTTWIHVTVPIDPAAEAAIRRDIASIAGATVQE